MTKLSLMALNDYISDTNDLNLKLFAMSVNPMVNLNARKKVELNALIDKYKRDSAKLRLVAIESYLGATPTQKKVIRKASQSVIPIINQHSPQQEGLITELSDLRGKLKKAYSMGTTSESGMKQQQELSDAIIAIETELGLYEQRSEYEQYKQGGGNDIDSKKDLFKSLFGDYEQPGTAGWSLVNSNGMNQFSITDCAFAGLWFSTDNKNVFEQMVYQITGKKKQAYVVTEDKSASPSMWIFSKSAVKINNSIKDENGRIYGAETFDKMSLAEKI